MNNQPKIPKQSNQRWWVFAGWVILIVLVAVIGYVAWISLLSLQGSQTLVMGRLATRRVREYVANHDGAWPKSWGDLDTIDADSSFANRGDGKPMTATFRKVVVIDFTANPAELAQQDVASFTAIRPLNVPINGEYRGYWDLDGLLVELRKHHSGAGNSVK